MKLQVLVTGAAIAALAVGAASAATHHRRHAAKGESLGQYAPPAQPIAYSKLDAYMKASPKQRARGDWTNETATAAAAPTGTAANAAASPAPSAPAGDAAPSAPPPAQAPQDQNGAAGGSATPPAAPQTTPSTP